MKIECCSFCLAMDVKLYPLGHTATKHLIEHIMKENGISQGVYESHLICYMCKAYSDKFNGFVQQVIRTQGVLVKLGEGKVTLATLRQIDRQKYGISFNLVTHPLKNIDFLPTDNNKSDVDDDDDVRNDGDEFDGPDIKSKFQDEITTTIDLTDTDSEMIDDQQKESSGQNYNNIEDNFVKIDIPKKLKAQNDENDLTDTCIKQTDPEKPVLNVNVIIDHRKIIYVRENPTIEIPKKVKAKNNENEEIVPTLEDNVIIGKPKKVKAKNNENDEMDPEFNIKEYLKPKQKKQNVKPNVIKKTHKKRTLQPSNFILSLSNIGDKSERRKKKANYVIKSNSEDNEKDDDFIPESLSEDSSSSDEEITYNDNGRIMKKERVYPRDCDECGFEILRGREHYIHYLRVHPNIPYPFACDAHHVCQFCGKNYKHAAHLRDHEMIHSNKETFCCWICPKKFVNRDRLGRHVRRTHTKTMLECDFCNRKFKQRVDIIRHIRIHTGEKPFKCHLCSASFAHKGNVRLHIRAKHEQLDQDSKKKKRERKYSDSSVDKRRNKKKRTRKRKYSSDDSSVNIMELKKKKLKKNVRSRNKD